MSLYTRTGDKSDSDSLQLTTKTFHKSMNSQLTTVCVSQVVFSISNVLFFLSSLFNITIINKTCLWLLATLCNIC